MDKKLIMTVGLPRSGKSTWAQGIPHPIVNPDSIRLALHGKPFIPSAEGFVWAVAKVMVNALFLAGHDTVTLDATNATRKRRDEWKSKTWTREFRTFDTTKNECRRRAKETNMEFLLPIIDKMHDQFEEVSPDEQP